MRTSRWMLAAMALCSAGVANAEGRIECVSAASVAGRTEVVIEGSNLETPALRLTDGGNGLAVDFHADLNGKARTMEVNANGLKTVRVRWRSTKPSIVCVDMRMDASVPRPTLQKVGNSWHVAFGKVERPIVAQLVRSPRPLLIQKAIAATPSTVQVAEYVPMVAGLTVGVRAPLPTIRTRVARQDLPSMLPAAPPAPRIEDLRVSLDFVNTDVVQVLKALALQAGVNIVTSPEVKGTITVSLHDVTVETALKMVTSLAGVAFRRIDETYVVASNAQIQAIYRQVTGEPEPKAVELVTEVYHVAPGQAAKLVQSVAGGKGEGSDTVGGVRLTYPPAVKEATRTDANGTTTTVRDAQGDSRVVSEGIVLRGPADEVTAMKGLFDKLLIKGETTLLDVYEVQFIDPLQLAAQLSNSVVGLRATVPPPTLINVVKSTLSQGSSAGGGGAAGGSGGSGGSGSGGSGSGGSGGGNGGGAGDSGSQTSSSVSATAMPMRVLLQGTAEQIKAAREYATRVDVAPKQVAFELRVMELNREEALRLGIDWSILGSNGSVRTFRVNQGLGDTTATGGTVSGRFSEGTNVLATLDSIANRRNLIARPNLLAVDGRISDLFVGDVVRYVKSIQATQNGITIIDGEVRIGVQLGLLPRVGADKQVMLELYTKLDYLTGFIPVPGGGQLPQTSERRTETAALMKSGETIAIGGLIRDEDRRNVSGIPFLKDLPIIGQLFKRTNNGKVRTEIVFFLTAKEVDDATRADAARPKPDVPPKP